LISVYIEIKQASTFSPLSPDNLANSFLADAVDVRDRLIAVPAR
jgi:hypothetical protein